MFKKHGRRKTKLQVTGVTCLKALKKWQTVWLTAISYGVKFETLSTCDSFSFINDLKIRYHAMWICTWYTIFILFFPNFFVFKRTKNHYLTSFTSINKPGNLLYWFIICQSQRGEGDLINTLYFNQNLLERVYKSGIFLLTRKFLYEKADRIHGKPFWGSSWPITFKLMSNTLILVMNGSSLLLWKIK